MSALQNKTDEFQKNCQDTVQEVLLTFKNKKQSPSYEDVVNVWTFQKLAEFELRLSRLENN